MQRQVTVAVSGPRGVLLGVRRGDGQRVLPASSDGVDVSRLPESAQAMDVAAHCLHLAIMLPRAAAARALSGPFVVRHLMGVRYIYVVHLDGSLLVPIAGMGVPLGASAIGSKRRRSASATAESAAAASATAAEAKAAGTTEAAATAAADEQNLHAVAENATAATFAKAAATAPTPATRMTSREWDATIEHYNAIAGEARERLGPAGWEALPPHVFTHASLQWLPVRKVVAAISVRATLPRDMDAPTIAFLTHIVSAAGAAAAVLPALRLLSPLPIPTLAADAAEGKGGVHPQTMVSWAPTA